MDPLALLVLIIGAGSSIIILLTMNFFDRAPHGMGSGSVTALFPRNTMERLAMGQDGPSGPTLYPDDDILVDDILGPGQDGIRYSRLENEWQPRCLQDVRPEVLAMILEKVSGFRDIQTSVKLNDLLHTPYSSTKDIGEIIATNPLLAGKILRTINSSYFGLPAEIQSIDRAVAMLGNDILRPLVLQDGLHATISRQIPLASHSDFNSHWIHATAVASCARHLGEEVFSWQGEDLYTMGLLHDVGKYILPMLAANKIGRTRGMPSPMHEEERFGVSHTLLGAMIAGEWQMSAKAIGCIEYHHHPLFSDPDQIPEESRTPSFIICLADLICKVLGYTGNDAELFPIRDDYFEEHGLSSDLMQLITPALISEVDQASQRVKALIKAG